MELIERLKEFGIFKYKIITLKKESCELYYVHESLETKRTILTTSKTVTVYKEDENYLKEATFTLYPEDDNYDQYIKKALEDMEVAKNPKYELYKNNICDFKSSSNFKDYSLSDLADKVKEIVFSFNSKSTLNATEIFVSKYNKNILTSENVDANEEYYDCFVETIPTFNKGEESFELYEAYSFSNLDEVQIKEEIERKLKEVEDRANAIPLSNVDADIIFNHDELSTIFSNVVYNFNYSSIYNKINLFKLNDNLQKENKADKLTITMKKSSLNSVYSRNFDNDGVLLKDTLIIKDGIAVGEFGSHKFKEYLNKEETGNLEIISVKKGTYEKNDLYSKPYVEIVSMSGIQVSDYSDYVGGEVRLAYYFDENKKVPVTGFSIAGKLSTLLNNLKLSNDVVSYGDNYEGPSIVRTTGFKIL